MLKSPGPKILWLPVVTGRSRRHGSQRSEFGSMDFCIWALGLGMGQNDQPQNEMIYYRTQKRIKMQK